MDPLSAALAEIETNGDEKEVKLVEKEENEDKPKPKALATKTRERLPVKQPDKNNSNLWSVLKQCIGKELSKITMPVQWNEPISLLQRVSEYMNYAYLLKRRPRPRPAKKD